MAETALPALHGDDGLVGLDDAHGEGVLETIADPVVNICRGPRRGSSAGATLCGTGKHPPRCQNSVGMPLGSG